jgi:integrase
VCNKPALLIATKTRNFHRVPLTPETRQALLAAIGWRTAGPMFLMPHWTDDHPPEMADQTTENLRARFSRFLEQEQQRLLAAGGTWSRAAQAQAAKRGWKRMGGVRAQDIRRVYIKLMRKAGLPKRTCVKDFRHSWPTTLQAAGVDPFARKEMLGHRGLEQTGQYTHTSLETLHQETERARATRATALPALQSALME